MRFFYFLGCKIFLMKKILFLEVYIEKRKNMLKIYYWMSNCVYECLVFYVFFKIIIKWLIYLKSGKFIIV